MESLFWSPIAQCQFNFACVIIEPLDHGSNQVTVKARDDLKPLIGNIEKKIVSDKNVSLLARQLALHINVSWYWVNFAASADRCM